MNTLSKLTDNLNTWTHFKKDFVYDKKGIYIPSIIRNQYHITYNDRLVSCIVNSVKGKPFFKAWGYMDEENCSYHAFYINNKWTEPIEGCADVKYGKDDDGGDTMMIIYNDKLINVVKDSVFIITAPIESNVNYFKLYKPLIYSAISAIILGIVLTFTHILHYDYIMNIMGIFITIIALLKFRNKKNFESMFASYDPIARKYKLYSKYYPYLELSLGILTLLHVFPALINILIVAVYSITTYGIIKSINNNEKLNCACVGGEYNIPLSKITVIENSIMIFMSLFYLVF